MDKDILHVGGHTVYNFIGKYVEGREDYIFMNFGYCELSEDEENKRISSYLKTNRSLILENHDHMARLYFHLCETFTPEFDNKDILEIGSGRGGGAWFITQNYPISSYTGLDISYQNIKFCNSRYDIKNLSFIEGTAEDLPFKDGSKDIVLNVESSHFYQDFEGFISETRRVLKKGGYFIFCDMCMPVPWKDRLNIIKDQGFEIILEADLNKNIVKSLNVYDHIRRAEVDKIAPLACREEIVNFVGTKGSKTYKDFENETLNYPHIIARKI